MRAINEAIEGADAYTKMIEKIQEGKEHSRRLVHIELGRRFDEVAKAITPVRNETRKQRRARLREESKRARQLARVPLEGPAVFYAGKQITGVIVDELATLAKDRK